MCGIVGISAERPIVHHLIAGLQALEYRGYDSAGIAMLTPNGIERLRDIVMIELGEEAHEVVGDVAAGRQCAQDVHLDLVEAYHLVRGEAAKGEPMRRVRFGDGQVGQVDFVEAAIFLAPEHIAPGAVERCDIAITFSQPDTERSQGSG